jgi:HEAT repeat protein
VTLAGAPLLRALRESADPKERRKAAEAAAREGPAGEAALVEAMAGDADGTVRAAAAEALGTAGTAAVAGPALLSRAKGDRDPAVRAAAIESLGLLRFPGGVDDLKAIAAAEPLLLRPCLFALARIRTEGALAALRTFRDGELVAFLLSEDFLRQEEDLRRVRAGE